MGQPIPEAETHGPDPVIFCKKKSLTFIEAFSYNSRGPSLFRFYTFQMVISPDFGMIVPAASPQQKYEREKCMPIRKNWDKNRKPIPHIRMSQEVA